MEENNIILDNINYSDNLLNKIKLVHDNIMKIENYFNDNLNIMSEEDKNNLEIERKNQINNFIALTNQLENIELTKINKSECIIDDFTKEKFMELENIVNEINNREEELKNNKSLDEFIVNYIKALNKFIKYIHNDVVELIINYSNFVKDPNNPNNPFYKEKEEGISVEELKKELEGENTCNCGECSSSNCNCDSSINENNPTKEVNDDLDISNTIVDPVSFISILENNCKLMMKLINEMTEEYKKEEYNDFIKACIKESLMNRVIDYNYNVNIIKAIRNRDTSIKNLTANTEADNNA